MIVQIHRIKLLFAGVLIVRNLFAIATRKRCAKGAPPPHPHFNELAAHINPWAHTRSSAKSHPLPLQRSSEWTCCCCCCCCSPKSLVLRCRFLFPPSFVSGGARACGFVFFFLPSPHDTNALPHAKTMNSPPPPPHPPKHPGRMWFYMQSEPEVCGQWWGEGSVHLWPRRVETISFCVCALVLLAVDIGNVFSSLIKKNKRIWNLTYTQGLCVLSLLFCLTASSCEAYSIRSSNQSKKKK